MRNEERVSSKGTVELEADTVRQMLSLYRAIESANASYTSGTAMYMNRANHITDAANARNVKRAFQRAASALGEEL